METITGTHAKATIFADSIEEPAREFVEQLVNHEAFKDTHIVQMPDVHAGNGCNVGTAFPISEYVNPDHVGVDIGCTISMHALSQPIAPELFPLVEHRIREAIPMGTDICDKNKLDEKALFKFLTSEYNKARSAAPHLINECGRIDAAFITSFCKRIKLQEGIFYRSLGTLGGGNHYIEYGEDDNSGQGWLSIHTGSRNLGLKVANTWHAVAANPKRTAIPGYLSGDALHGYLSDMVIAQAYARFNHMVIADRIAEILKKTAKAKIVDRIITTHNYISVTDDVPMLRKGAIDASEGLRVCIPFNMRDGIAIAVGKGNAEWNNTAPHGAGRAMSRAAARKQIAMEDFKAAMEGICTSSVCESTIDESPAAYKPTDLILELIKPTVDVIAMVRPRINLKDTSGK